jgi:Pilus formation protein N terminal region
MSKLHLGICAALLFTISFAAPAAAETVINVTVDKAKMLNIAGQAGTVVVGNPNIADVSVRGSQVFIHGRTQGATNVIVLDRDGNQLAALEVNVDTQGTAAMAVYGAGRRYSYNCAPSCEPTLQVGDSYDDYFKMIAQENGNKTGLGAGTAASDAAAK